MKRQIGLVIVLVMVVVSTLLVVAALDTETGCTLRCQGLEEDAAWEACMLECHRGLR